MVAAAIPASRRVWKPFRPAQPVIHAECVGGEIDPLVNRWATVAFSPGCLMGDESSIGRNEAMVDDEEYEQATIRKAELPKTRFSDGYDSGHVERINRLTQRY